MQVGNVQHDGQISGPQLQCHSRRHCHGLSQGIIYVLMCWLLDVLCQTVTMQYIAEMAYM